MRTLKIEIELDNEAFQDGNEATEVARILDDLTKTGTGRLDSIALYLRDINGNRVGAVTVINQ